MLKSEDSRRGLKAVRILLVEDDFMLGEAVRDGLRQEGYVVDWVQDGDTALAALSTTAFSALLLDLALLPQPARPLRVVMKRGPSLRRRL